MTPSGALFVHPFLHPLSIPWSSVSHQNGHEIGPPHPFSGTPVSLFLTRVVGLSPLL